MTPPILPDVARSIIKSVICSLANVGLITDADAENLIRFLWLGDA
jgi:hypothetical protein